MENASRSSECRQAPVGVGARAFAAVIVLLLTVPEAIAAKLGGPYYVDDAEIGKVGSCEIKSWASFAANKDHIYVFSPACVLNLGAPVELGTNLVNLRSEGVGNSTASLTAKIVPLPIGGGGFGLALSGAFVYDLTDKNINSVILNVPLTYDFGKHLRFNINVGAQYMGRLTRYRAEPARAVRHRGSGRRLERGEGVERHFRGVRADGPGPIEPTLSKRPALQPHQRRRLGCHLRPQPHR